MNYNYSANKKQKQGASVEYNRKKYLPNIIQDSLDVERRFLEAKLAQQQ